MIMYLAALKSVPEQLYEAASIDGANWWQRIWYVTLPMMRNIIAITVLFSLIVTFANFDIVRVLTAGGPIDQTHVFATWAFKARHRGRRHPARRHRVAVHGADPGVAAIFILRDINQAGERSLMAAASQRPGAAPRPVSYGSISATRASGRWSGRMSSWSCSRSSS
jgi:multiple sugar transport system permease protein